ncbi:putative late blight resistance protein homolog R1B-14 [Andrographis paniculata]|uniref:putative late blight resistance protein homolog R1B-14 n=1 Tax=Andrographis paniculata TaxID=175694 RepID=UPI0021E7ED91|nr:putative late blight resistance protein homolog R1B-14 [Andrographis paniculata]
MSIASSSNVPSAALRIDVVGLKEELDEIIHRATGGSASRQVIPIVGMGGIGKTTLARSLYELTYIKEHFDQRIWITISQDRTFRELLLQFPICQQEQDNSEIILSDDQLGVALHKSLFGRRYLIVLDDMWNLKDWDNLQLYFPNAHETTGRIIVTTRLANVAKYFSSCSLEMKFLDKDESWELFRKTTFGQETCPNELIDVGKGIAQKCKGLPLSIVVVGGLLKKSCREKAYWESVAKDINSFMHSEGDVHCQNVLSLSYNRLFVHLKPCFLYMAIFPEDHEINVSQLIKLWVAEGFFEPDDDEGSWEGVLEGYLKDLVDRNLILVRRWGLKRKIKTCYMHDVLRDLCIRMAKKEEFICVVNSPAIPQGLHNQRRVVLHGKRQSQVLKAIQQPLRSRTLICGGEGLPRLVDRSLRVLDAVEIGSFEDVFKHVHLRYIGCKSSSLRSIPSTISQLLNVQTIICHNTFLASAPTAIWIMKHLRHVVFNEIHLPDPPQITDLPALEHLQTFMKVVNFKCSGEVLRRMRQIKKLQIKYEEFAGESRTAAYFYAENLCHFPMLESLKVSFYVKRSLRLDFQQLLTYPSSLKKLTLDNVELCWNDLEKFGRLPKLEDLKLKGAIAGDSWDPIEGGFDSLKSLRIVAFIDLIIWNADKSHFPVLEVLDLGGVPKLEKIPLEIGDIATLKVIKFCSSRADTAISVMRILAEQESFGNEGLQARVTFMNKIEERRFWEMAETEELGSSNFVVETGK